MQSEAAFLYGYGVNFALSHSFGVRAEYRGFVYDIPDFKLDGLNLKHLKHLAQPSVKVRIHGPKASLMIHSGQVI